MYRIVIAGAGVSGLTAALLLARSGHRVIVIEKDKAPPPRDPERAFSDWHRPGVPQWRLIHSLLARLRLLLAEHLPDLLDGMKAVGSRDALLAAALPQESRVPEDSELAVLLCRRALFEWALRARCAEEPRIEVRNGLAVTGLVGDHGDVPVVHGVRLGGGMMVDADLVIDATGRASGLDEWITALGGRVPVRRSSPVGIIYFSRFYELRENAGWLPSFRVDTDYGTVALTPADGAVFSISFFADSTERTFRGLRHDSLFERAVSLYPELRQWRASAFPIAPIHTMGDFRNHIREVLVDGRPSALGVVPLGDSIVCTDPSFSRGLPAAVMHAIGVSGALKRQPPSSEAFLNDFEQGVMPEARALYADVSSACSERIADRTGGGVLGPRARANLALTAAAQEDPEVWRALTRYRNYLASPETVFGNPALMDRVYRLAPATRPSSTPSRAELVQELRRIAPTAVRE